MFGKKKKEYKALRDLDAMSDEEFLENYKKLKIKSKVMGFGGLLMIILCIVAIVIFFNLYGGYK